ncbi:hypothetical protein M2135_002750 [Parabacteroides sp. PF5-9]|nr:hypothetical protein [Parabacteroides sp. PF5-9]
MYLKNSHCLLVISTGWIHLTITMPQNNFTFAHDLTIRQTNIINIEVLCYEKNRCIIYDNNDYDGMYR